MDWKTHKKQLFSDPEFVKVYKETVVEYEIAKALFDARTKRGLTQKELALKLKTKQSVISRVESAKTSPSLAFLKRLASVLGGHLTVSFNI